MSNANGGCERTGQHRKHNAYRRSRKAGAGRKPVWKAQTGIFKSLEEFVSAHTKGDPMSTLLWTNKSLRNLEKRSYRSRIQGVYRVVGEMLKMLGYGLQTDKKALTTTQSHMDRDKQFEYINSQCLAANEKGFMVLSIDAKKKENIGNFKNNGKTYQKQRCPIEVLDHDFPMLELGKVTPYGIYNIFKNQEFVSVGTICNNYQMKLIKQ